MPAKTKKPTKKSEVKKQVKIPEQEVAPDVYRLSISKALLILAVLTLLFGIGLSLRGFEDNKLANERAATLVYQANHNINHSVPSTNKPTISAFDSFTAPATYPRYITIPKLSVKAVVRPLGVTTTNQLEAPDNVYDTGWYNRSSKPGQPGAMVVDGHISSWTTKGVFYGISTLKTGDLIQIQRGDGLIISYKVVENQTYSADQVDMNKVLGPINASKPGLNLISCSGQVVKGTSEFNNRTVIYAEAI